MVKRRTHNSGSTGSSPVRPTNERVNMKKPVNLVLIEGTKYTFFVDRVKIVSVQSKDMNKFQLEGYRRNIKSLLDDLGATPESA